MCSLRIERDREILGYKIAILRTILISPREESGSFLVNLHPRGRSMQPLFPISNIQLSTSCLVVGDFTLVVFRFGEIGFVTFTLKNLQDASLDQHTMMHTKMHDDFSSPVLIHIGSIKN